MHGVVRRASTFNTDRLDGIYSDPHESGVCLHLHYGDVTDERDFGTYDPAIVAQLPHLSANEPYTQHGVLSRRSGQGSVASAGKAGTLPSMATPRTPRDPLFLGRWFQDEVIVVAVHWY